MVGPLAECKSPQHTTTSQGRPWVTEPQIKFSKKKSTESTRRLSSGERPTCYCNPPCLVRCILNNKIT